MLDRDDNIVHDIPRRAAGPYSAIGRDGWANQLMPFPVRCIIAATIFGTTTAPRILAMTANRPLTCSLQTPFPILSAGAGSTKVKYTKTTEDKNIKPYRNFAVVNEYTKKWPR
jgi:hypothetical protein